MKQKKWNISAHSEGAVSHLCKETGISRLAACVLVSRGYDTPEKAAVFLKDDEKRLLNPWLLKDMETAVSVIWQSIQNHEKMVVYGDYDVDGVTATCVLMQFLRKLGARCEYYIPDRLSEGYGLNVEALRRLKENGADLVITVDSGITAVEEARFAREIGLKLIITDHHECRQELPCALAVVNPRRPDSDFPFRELAGVGVAFELICAMSPEKTEAELLEEYGELVAVGTIADVMPLTGENRHIVKSGLRTIAHTHNVGLKMLMQKAGMDKKRITSNAISFVMSPRINAAGRLGHANTAVELFMTEDAEYADTLADALCELNRSRQEAENEILEEILERLKTEFDPARDHVIVMWGEGWHHGVIGIVSSRIADKFCVPAVLISLDGETGKGSGRSVPGFNLFGALESCADLLTKYGGHELAVGLSIKREDLPELRRRMNACTERFSKEMEQQPTILVDCQIEAKDITLSEAHGLYVLEPYGMSNQQPVFALTDAVIEEITPISSDRHLKMTLAKDGCFFQAFMFGVGSSNCRFVENDHIDVVFHMEVNQYRGRENVQIILKDVRRSAQEDKRDEKERLMYERFLAGGSISAQEYDCMNPTRDDLVSVFRHIRANAGNGVLNIDAGTLYRKVRRESRRKISLCQLFICLDIFREFRIFDYKNDENNLMIRINPYEGKVDISGSKILRKLKEAKEA